MILRLVLLTVLLAHRSLADVSELVQSGNGFLYDAPVNTNLPLAPLDLANDVQTLKAFTDTKSATKSSFEITIAPSIATAASMKKTVTAQPPIKFTVGKPIHTSSHKKSGYNYAAPLKPFFIT